MFHRWDSGADIKFLWLQNKTSWISEVKSQRGKQPQRPCCWSRAAVEVSVPGAWPCSTLLSSSSSVKFHFLALINSLTDIFMGNQGTYRVRQCFHCLLALQTQYFLAVCSLTLMPQWQIIIDSKTIEVFNLCGVSLYLTIPVSHFHAYAAHKKVEPAAA